MLGFFLGVVLVVGAVWLATAARWFRWVLGIGIACALVFVLFLFAYDASLRREREASTHRIPLTQVQFEDLVMRDMGTSYSTIEGRIKNTSPTYTLTSIELEVFLQDCVAEKCETVGQTTATSYIQVPPGQSRAYSSGAHFSDLPAARGAYRWSYRVRLLRAELPSNN